MGAPSISLQADPTFDEIQAAGAISSKRQDAYCPERHVPDLIPRVTAYEVGLKRGFALIPPPIAGRKMS